MTNAQIILESSIFLMEQGLLKPTDQKVIITDEQGSREVFMPEPIHTFAAWRAMGYSVKKGEHAIAKFPIWKMVGKQKQDEDDEKDDQKRTGRMFMKVAFFFTADQVKKLDKKGE